MVSESLALTLCSPPFPDPNFPPLPAYHSHKPGHPSVSRNPVARASPGNPISLMPVPSIFTLYEPFEPPHPSPPPSSPSAIASPLFPTFLSSHVQSILANDSTAPILSTPGSPCGAAFEPVLGLTPSGLSSPPALDASRFAAEVPSLAGVD
ncbi:hypothetical protein Nepgr_032255 [Nepenthes gracilis]|uniref:Uncharacterized protein n=1 Tax=Nepenthes gracilis TaxID=150966 RepID=A0AAD3TJ45_NEPGR|nr:hypothetical protein Nepgr_032255 [Nepenthes gracilis]